MASSLPPDLAVLLEPFCATHSGPGPVPFQAVNLEGVHTLAKRRGISLAKAMALCLEHDIWPLRFTRNRGVFLAQEQRGLLESRAAIIGCGGLGGHVATLLARAGVGAFTLCDCDVFDESNLNRQILCRETALGRNKALVAREELAAIASHADVRVFPVVAGPDNLPEILHGASIVMDCLDSLATRCSVAAAADAAGIPFIHGAVAGDEGFAMLVRPGEKSLDLLYPDRVRFSEHASNGRGAESRLGVPTLTPAAIAVLQASLALQVLTGKKPGSARLWHFDIAGPMLEVLTL
ncbi:MAG: HesA/MoeB/ThiF family protein [Deltaproteobacteria bacterium]|jgi:molybdopterin/thiamine biosynthesis adenylyltransferase|nr:HesA/MoeB/ThiF family protein [Deltaproteobacteria bacterium]